MPILLQRGVQLDQKITPKAGVCHSGFSKVVHRNQCTPAPSGTAVQGSSSPDDAARAKLQPPALAPNYTSDRVGCEPHGDPPFPKGVFRGPGDNPYVVDALVFSSSRASGMSSNDA